MLNRTPTTFKSGQKIFHLECRFGDSEPELKPYFVVRQYLCEGRLAVLAVPQEEWVEKIKADFPPPPLIDISTWFRGENSQGMVSFPVGNRFFFPPEEVAILAKIGSEKKGINGLLKFFDTDEGATHHTKEQSVMIANYVWYWKDLHHKTQT